MKRFLFIALALVLLFSVGCSARMSESPSAMPQKAAKNDMYDMSFVSGGGVEADYGGVRGNMSAPATAAPMAPDAIPAPDFGGHKIIRTFYLSLETNAFDSDLAALLKTVSDHGGYAQSSEVRGRKPEVYNDPGRSASLTLRIPSAQADAFFMSAKGIGTLLSENSDAQDITEAYFDLETRLNVLRTQLERLTSILVKTDNLADIIQLESEIARVTLEIEQLTTQLRRYDGLVDYATVSISLYELSLNEGPAAQQTVGERIQRGFTSVLYGMGTFFVNLFVFIVIALPVLVPLGVIALVVILLVRAKRRRKAKKIRAELEKGGAAEPENESGPQSK